MDLKDRHILITQLRLHDYAGSEMVTLELAEYLLNQGAKVTVVTKTFGDPIEEDFRKLGKNLKLLLLYDKNIDQYFKSNPVDIAWIHHQIIPDYILDKPGDTKFIFHHMSPFLEIEAPLFWRIESSLASAILCNSEETKDTFIKKGYIGGEGSIYTVFNNPAPSNFLRSRQKNAKKKLTSVLFVSNHIPEELQEAGDILKRKGVEVDYFGETVGKPERITDEVILRYDVVVTIGKTVQYAVLAGIPAYCYDWFGGPGYLTDDNYKKAEYYNFSGRGFGKKSANTIAEEIIDNYEKAVFYTLNIDEDIIERFRLDTRINQLLSSVLKGGVRRVGIDKKDRISYKALLKQLLSPVKGSAYGTKRRKEELEEVKQDNKSKTEELNQLRVEIDQIKSSTSFKIGNKIAQPLRYGKNILSSVLRKLKKRGNKLPTLLSRYYSHYVGVSNRRRNITIILMNASGPSSSSFIRLISPLVLSGKYNITILDGLDYKQISKDTDICVVQRVALKDANAARSLVDLLSIYDIPLIVDTDDAFFDIPKTHPEYNELIIRSDGLSELMRHADVNIFSTERLAKKYKEFLALNNTSVVRNTLDRNFWSRWRDGDYTNLNSGPLKMLYMGTPTHHADFKIIEPALDRIHNETPGSFMLYVMGVSKELEQKEWITVVDVESGLYPAFVPWFNLIDTFDIGLSPLEDNEFNSNKSDIKCLDYLAIGAHPVVSDVEPYSNPLLDEIITRVKNTEGAWYEAITQLIAEKDTVRSNKYRVKSGYEYLSRYRSAEVAAKELEQIIDDVLKKRVK